jgi:glutaredoxin
MANTFSLRSRTYNCLDDQELREGIKEYSSWPTIPQIYLKSEFIGGCDLLLGSKYNGEDMKLYIADRCPFLETVHQSGELEELLTNAGLVTKPAATEQAA